LLPAVDAGCQMFTDAITGEVRRAKAERPEALVVSYVNTPAAVKAMSDICCTSSNAAAVVASLPREQEVIFVPDANLGSWAEEQCGRELLKWQGGCPIHGRLTVEDVRRARAEHPGALVLMHPECRPEVRELADYIGSTTGIVNFAQKSQAEEFIIATLDGNARSILTGERLALNLLQHLSGVATRTHKLAAIAAPYGARLVDTRKTTPGMRLLDKYAVKVGGGANHRLGLYDAMLIKDNHIKVAGGIRAALERARAYASHMTKIEIEVEDLAGVEEALAGKADVIMLDNMAPDMMAEAVRLIDHRAVVEASGGIDETTLAAAAESGVDVISVGALTHSVKALDISMDIGKIK